jgi:hypothetical protein
MAPCLVFLVDGNSLRVLQVPKSDTTIACPVIAYGHCLIFQMAEAALFRRILYRIAGLCSVAVE